MYSIFVGGVDYCKVTKHGIPHVQFKGHIEYSDGKCKIEVHSVPR